jgi:hypothetical protein
MRWFRCNIRLGARLALFALAVQIGLSFAHVHLGELAAPSAAASIVADGASSSAPKQKPIGNPDPGCAICALIQLASTSAPAAAPALPLPVALLPVRLDVVSDLAFAASPHSLFQARAPPSV